MGAEGSALSGRNLGLLALRVLHSKSCRVLPLRSMAVICNAASNSSHLSVQGPLHPPQYAVHQPLT